MRWLLAAVVFWLCLAPGPAGAVEAVFGAEGQSGYNTNLFFQAEDPTGDGTFRLGPTLALRDQTGQLTWEIAYRPSYEIYYTVSGINAAYQLGNGRVSWRPSAATEFYAQDSLSYTPIRSSTFETNQPGIVATPAAIFSNNYVTQNNGRAGVRHAFTQRWLGEILLANGFANYQGNRYADSMVTVGQVFATYAWTPADRLGSGLGVTRQTISPPFSERSSSYFYQLYAIWDHDFSPDWQLRINAGPTIIDPEAVELGADGQDSLLFSRRVPTRSGDVVSPLTTDGCAPLNGILYAELCPNLGGLSSPLDASQTVAIDGAGQPVNLSQTSTLRLIGPTPESGERTLTYFADVSMTRRWSWFDALVRYNRTASTSSGFSQSFITDTVTLAGTWNPSPLWRLTVTGLVTRRESDSVNVVVLTQVAPVAIPLAFNPDTGFFAFNGAQAQGLRAISQQSSLEIMNYGITLQLNRQLTRRSYLFGRASWELQTTKRDIVGTVDVTRYLFALGFRYEFDPIHLFN